MGGFSIFLGCTTEEKMGRDGGVRLEIAGVSGMRDVVCSLDVCLWKERKKMKEQSRKLRDSRRDACLRSPEPIGTQLFGVPRSQAAGLLHMGEESPTFVSCFLTKA
ncbi:unnamed protein product [Prunus armeniaca]